jgi:hypothetical protein
VSDLDEKNYRTREWLCFWDTWFDKKQELWTRTTMAALLVSEELWDAILFVESDKTLVQEYVSSRPCLDTSRCIYWSDDIHHDDARLLLDMVRVSAYGYLVPGMYSLPHFAQQCFFQPVTESKPRACVLVSGAKHQENRLRQAAIAHPLSVELEYGPFFQEAYGIRISQCLAALASTHADTRAYVTAKFFEIPASGALLLADDRVKSALLTLGFRDRVHCLFCNEHNVAPKIDFILNPKNRTVVDAIRKQGQIHVMAYHALDNRLMLLDSILQDVLPKSARKVDARLVHWPSIKPRSRS